MTAWRMARSLDVLLGQLNAAAPRRSKVSDGGIGDQAHITRASDHNPWVRLDDERLVTARDFTHDPAGGLDCGRLAGALCAGRDLRVKYVIWDRRITSGAGGPSPWAWRPYRGSNAHTKHLHVSVVADVRADGVQPWAVYGPVPPSSPPPAAPAAPAARKVLRFGMEGVAEVRRVQAFLARSFPSYAGRLPATSNYMEQTVSVVLEFQRRSGIGGPDADGRTIGPRTWAALVAHGYR